MKRKSSHKKALEKIAANPSKYGFRNILASSIEPNLFDNGGRQVAQPDLVLYDRRGEIHIVEYKSNGNPELIKRAEEQLYHTISWFSKYTKISQKIKIIDGSRYPELRRIR